MNIQEIFGKSETPLTWEQFEQLAKESGAKFTDLSEGKYVSKQKYDDDLGAKDKQISTLNETISQRDSDLDKVQKQLADAGTDADKLAGLNSQLSALQSKYDADIKNYQEQIAQQARDFAIKDFALTQKFSSNAAKRDFINFLSAKNPQVENGQLIGANDWVTQYSEENPDAFLTEGTPEPDGAQAKPQFVLPTTPSNGSGSTPDANAFHFNFTGVRSRETN